MGEEEGSPGRVGITFESEGRVFDVMVMCGRKGEMGDWESGKGKGIIKQKFSSGCGVCLIVCRFKDGGFWVRVELLLDGRRAL